MRVEVLAAMVALLPGCASFVTLDMLPRDVPPTPYIGALRDADLVFTSPSNWGWITPLALIDLPLSFAFDTVTLPWSSCREPPAEADALVDDRNRSGSK